MSTQVFRMAVAAFSSFGYKACGNFVEVWFMPTNHVREEQPLSSTRLYTWKSHLHLLYWNTKLKVVFGEVLTEYLLIIFPRLSIISSLTLCLNKLLRKYLLWVLTIEILIIPKGSCIWKCDVNTWKFWRLINKLTSTFVYLYVHFDNNRIWTMNGEKVEIFWLIWEKCSHLLLKHVLFTLKNLQSPYLGKSKSLGKVGIYSTAHQPKDTAECYCFNKLSNSQKCKNLHIYTLGQSFAFSDRVQKLTIGGLAVTGPKGHGKFILFIRWSTCIVWDMSLRTVKIHTTGWGEREQVI